MKITGIGIDIVSLPRVQSFIKRHGLRGIRRVLSPSEKRSLAKRPVSPRQFSKVFVAKEAYSKACGFPLLGIDGFRAIQVKILPQNRFRVKSLQSGSSRRGEAQGCFFQTKGLIGAQVIRWDD